MGKAKDDLCDKKWYNWPEGYYEKPWFPWYKILWRLAITPILFTSFSLFYLSVLVGFGFNEAERFRKDVF